MKDDEYTAQIISGHRREIEIDPVEVDNLKARIDSRIASEAGVSDEESRSEDARQNLTYFAAFPKKQLLPSRKFTRVAACAAALGVATWATFSIVHQPSSWAEGVTIPTEEASQFVAQCIRSAIEKDELSQFSFDESDENFLIWNDPVSGQTERLDAGHATIQFAEQRGTATGLWFTLEDTHVGACLVDDNEAVSALSPLSSLTEQVGVYNGFFSTFTLREGSQGNIYGDTLQFEQTSTEFIRYEAVFTDGTQVTGTVQNGFFIVMKRVDYPQYDPEVPVGNGDAVVERLTLYRADGSGAQTSLSDNGPLVVEVQ